MYSSLSHLHTHTHVGAYSPSAVIHAIIVALRVRDFSPSRSSRAPILSRRHCRAEKTSADLRNDARATRAERETRAKRYIYALSELTHLAARARFFDLPVPRVFALRFAPCARARLYTLSNFWFTRPRWNSMNAKCNPLHCLSPTSFSRPVTSGHITTPPPSSNVKLCVSIAPSK